MESHMVAGRCQTISTNYNMNANGTTQMQEPQQKLQEFNFLTNCCSNGPREAIFISSVIIVDVEVKQHIASMNPSTNLKAVKTCDLCTI